MVTNFVKLSWLGPSQILELTTIQWVHNRYSRLSEQYKPRYGQGVVNITCCTLQYMITVIAKQLVPGCGVYTGNCSKYSQ